MGVGHGETDGVEQSVNEIFIEKLEWCKVGAVLGEDYCVYYWEKLRYSVVFWHLYYLSFGIFSFEDDSWDLWELGDGKGGAIDGVTRTDSYSYVWLFDGDEVVGSIADHSYFIATLSEDFLPSFSVFDFFLLLFFVFFDDKGFVLGRYSREDFYFVIHEIFRSFFYEIVVDGVELIRMVGECEVVNVSSLLYYLSILVVTQFDYLDFSGLRVISWSLDNDDGFVEWNHSYHESSFDSKKDVVSCNNFSVDLGVSQSRYGINSIIFESIDECYNTQYCDVIEVLFSLLIE